MNIINDNKWTIFSQSIAAGMTVTPSAIADLYDLECVDIYHRDWSIYVMKLTKLVERSFRVRWGYLPAIQINKGGFSIATGDQTPEAISKRTKTAYRSLCKGRRIAIGTAERAEATDSTRSHLHNQASALSQICNDIRRGDRSIFSSSSAARFRDAQARMRAGKKGKGKGKGEGEGESQSS